MDSVPAFTRIMQRELGSMPRDGFRCWLTMSTFRTNTRRRNITSCSVSLKQDPHGLRYLSDVVKANRDLNNYCYFIGLSYYNNDWYWEQPNGLGGRKATFTDWASGYPHSSGVVVKNVSLNGDAYWENTDRNNDKAYFCCDVWTCDTDNYCDNSVF